MNKRKRKATAKDYSIGGFMDGTVPPIDDVLEGLNIDPAQFSQWLSPILENYRFDSNIKFPPHSEQVKEVERFIAALEAVEAFTKPSALPLHPEADMIAKAHAAGFDWRENMKQLKLSAFNALHSTQLTLKEMKAHQGQSGNPGSRLRDELLNTIAQELEAAGSSRGRARELASEIITRSGIEIPKDERSVRRAAKRRGTTT